MSRGQASGAVGSFVIWQPLFWVQILDIGVESVKRPQLIIHVLTAPLAAARHSFTLQRSYSVLACWARHALWTMYVTGPCAKSQCA